MRYYIHEDLDNIMNLPKYSPRYASLARKALSHYLGDKYNPEEFPLGVEFMFRAFIRGYVELRVFDKEPYDWPFIDNFFKFYLANEGYDLAYDESKFMKGYNGVIRGDLPEYHC
jgi:hypothetical protein